MGRQSQTRLPPTIKTRSLSWKKRKFDDKTAHLDPNQRAVNDVSRYAFYPERDCYVCKARAQGRDPHRAHHPRCPHSQKYNANEKALNKYIKDIHDTITAPMKNPTDEEELTGGGTPGIRNFFSTINKFRRTENGKVPSIEVDTIND